MDDLGRAKQIKTNKDTTIIVDGLGEKSKIKMRTDEIKKQIASNAISNNVKSQLQERLAKLAGGVAVIKVGATTEVEMKEKKLRIEDALAATKAAVEEGIVAGGGTAYVDIIPNVKKCIEGLDKDEKIGAEIVLKALETPLKQIAVNAGDEPAIIFDKVASSKAGIGYNAQTGELVDMKSSGIVDPAKVTRTALENAVSVSKMILTTESIVTDKVNE
jgi:chaperonin GroEL